MMDEPTAEVVAVLPHDTLLNEAQSRLEQLAKQRSDLRLASVMSNTLVIGPGHNPTTCWCSDCESVVLNALSGWQSLMGRMCLCPDCGNKRCPRATNHRLACTRSNAPGQEGSRYA